METPVDTKLLDDAATIEKNGRSVEIYAERGAIVTVIMKCAKCDESGEGTVTVSKEDPP